MKAHKVELISVSGKEEDISKIAGISHESKKGPSVSNLLEWGHLSPFEFVNATFYIEAPIFVFRQVMRHRTAHIMEKSGRYTEFLPSDMYNPFKEGTVKYDAMNRSIESVFMNYKGFLEEGVPKEQARMILPVASMSKAYWQMDLRNLINFFKMRISSHAQKEVQELSMDMLDSLKKYLPNWYEYVVEHTDYKKLKELV